jgi:hypothetical protein
MGEQERENIRRAVTEMDRARSWVELLFGQAAKDADYDKAVIYQLIRDTMSQQIDALENLIVRHREDKE